VSNYGAILAGKTYYCLVPEDRSQVQDQPLFPGGPSARNFGYDEATLEVRTPRGDRLPNTKVILEREIWTSKSASGTSEQDDSGDRRDDSGLLVVIGQSENKYLPLCPMKLGFLAQPAELLKRVLPKLSVDMKNGTAVFHLNWAGIFCQRKYRVAMLPLGVAAWPPKEVPGWHPYFLLFGPGTKETSTAPFRRFEPVVYQEGASWPGGEVRVYEEGYIAMARTDNPPRLVGFRDQQTNHSDALGFSLIGPTNMGLSFLTPSEWVERAFLTAPPKQTASTEELRVAIDFGTSNTAIGVRSGTESPRLLKFENSGASVVTSSVDLDPYRYPTTAFRFFPKSSTYSNPLPTILLDIGRRDSRATPFQQSAGLPARVIPPPEPTFDEDEAQLYSREKVLKQDFKWLPGEGDVLRRAFLEQFAMVAAYELRCGLSQLPRGVTLTGSYPLAYEPQQHARLVEAFDYVKETFRQGGFQNVELEKLISESYANFLFIDDQCQDRDRTETGRLLVIDIGGGTTDISVSTKGGKICYLDSLLIGGKDLSQKLLPYRILQEERTNQVLSALNLREKPRSRSDRDWCDAVQYILIKKMKEGNGLKDLRSQFQKNGMIDLLGEILGLLTFATAYGARLALQPIPSVPSKVESLDIKFGGLGSRLFDMAPVFPPYARSWEAAKHVLQMVVSALPDLKDVRVSIDRIAEAKEAVCLGTALARAEDPQVNDFRGKLKTIWWSDIPHQRNGSGISWNSEFDARIAKDFTGNEINGANAQPLLELVEVAIEKVGASTFGDAWKPKEPAFSEMRQKVPRYYRNGCTRFADDNASGKMIHLPILQVTEGLKEILCAVIDE
jgi:hypothetical protein